MYKEGGRERERERARESPQNHKGHRLVRILLLNDKSRAESPMNGMWHPLLIGDGVNIQKLRLQTMAPA